MIDNHANINFHDAMVNSVYFRGKHLIWELAALALRTTNIAFPEKSKDDWWIKNAVMTLENACIEDVLGDKWAAYDAKNGKLIDSGGKNYSPDEYKELLKNISFKEFSYISALDDYEKLLKNGCEISGRFVVPPAGDGRYTVCIATTYQMIISFSKSIVQWDEFGGTEWYRNKLWSSEHPN